VPKISRGADYRASWAKMSRSSADARSGVPIVAGTDGAGIEIGTS